jgi:hypothetical protein
VNPIMMVLAYVAIMLLGCGGIIALAGFQQRRRSAAAELDDVFEPLGDIGARQADADLMADGPVPLQRIPAGGSRR